MSKDDEPIDINRERIRRQHGEEGLEFFDRIRRAVSRALSKHENLTTQEAVDVAYEAVLEETTLMRREGFKFQGLEEILH